MTNLPTKTDLTGTGTTESSFQAALGALYDFISQLADGAPLTEVTIASDTIAPSVPFIQVDTEGGAATDNLSHISSANIGQKVIALKLTSAARVVTLKHAAGGSGQLVLTGSADLPLDNLTKTIWFYYDGSNWNELWRNWGINIYTAADLALAQLALNMGTAATKAVGVASGQIPTADMLGAAAFKAVGTLAGQVPLNSNLGALAYLTQITSSNMNASGVDADTYTNIGSLTVDSAGRITDIESSGAGITTLYGIGSSIMAYCANGSAVALAPGTVVAGSVLRPSGGNNQVVYSYDAGSFPSHDYIYIYAMVPTTYPITTIPGTWQLNGYAGGGQNTVSLWTRIA